MRSPIAGRLFVCLSPLLVLGACSEDPEWRPLFNGRDLEGWTPKIRGYELGADPMGTFRVEDGLLTVGYERYGDFGDRFGHLFFEEPFSRYRLLVEYRFVGEQAQGGEAWARKNSGIMIHAQSPESMLREQDFPVSLEAQLLGGVDDVAEDDRDGTGADVSDRDRVRPTANLCTPGTHVEMDGRLVERHCIESGSPTFHGEEWVTVELLVLGDSLVVHLVNGDTVLSYDSPVVGGGAVNGFDPAAKPDGETLAGGYIALQSESHPIQFRRVLVREWTEDEPSR